MSNSIKAKRVIVLIIIVCILIVSLIVVISRSYNTLPKSNDNETIGDACDNSLASESDNVIEDDNEPILSDRRPMICIDNVVYFEYDYTYTLPENAEEIGTIKSVISQSEIPTESFSSNSDIAPIGSRIYTDEGTPTITYVERSDLENDTYVIYMSESELTPD